MKPRLRLCIYITIMLLFLTGCGEKIIRAPQVPMQVKQPFQTAVSIQYGDLNTEAILSKETDQNFRLEFQAPEVLQGMVLLFDPDQITIEYRDLIGSYQPDAIPPSCCRKAFGRSGNTVLSRRGHRSILKWSNVGSKKEI